MTLLPLPRPSLESTTAATPAERQRPSGWRFRLKALLLLVLVTLLGYAPFFASEPYAWERFFVAPSAKLAWLACVAERVLIGLIALAIVVACGIGPSWKALSRPRPLATAALVISAVALTFGAAFLVSPEAFEHDFFPVHPLVHPRHWALATGTLVLKAFCEELWDRALWQTLFSHVFARPWVGMWIAAAQFTLWHPLSHAPFIACGALLFGVVFLRTQSIVCTTALHVALNGSLGALHGADFMVSSFLGEEAIDAMRLPLGLALAALAGCVALWPRWRRQPSTSQPARPFPSMS